MLFIVFTPLAPDRKQLVIALHGLLLNLTLARLVKLLTATSVLTAVILPMNVAWAACLLFPLSGRLHLL